MEPQTATHSEVFQAFRIVRSALEGNAPALDALEQIKNDPPVCAVRARGSVHKVRGKMNEVMGWILDAEL